jgi:transcriptional regulator GlxA family with amidase domain
VGLKVKTLRASTWGRLCVAERCVRIDLALGMVERDLGTETARLVATNLVVHHRRAGGQSRHSVLLERDAKSDFHAETGQSPAKAIENLRVEAARLMTEQGRLPIDVVANETISDRTSRPALTATSKDRSSRRRRTSLRHQTVTHISISGSAAASLVVVSSYGHPGSVSFNRECGGKKRDDDRGLAAVAGRGH